MIHLGKMKTIDTYIIEKLHLNKDIKVSNNDNGPVLLISHSDVSSTSQHCSFYYYEIDKILDESQTIKLKNHKKTFYIVPDKYKAKYGDIFAFYIGAKNDEWGYLIHKDDGIDLIKDTLNKSILLWADPIGKKFMIEKPLGIRNDNITTKKYLSNLIDRLNNEKD